MKIPLGSIFYGGERVRCYKGDGIVDDVHIDPMGFDDYIVVKFPDGTTRSFLSSELERI